jgi:hypothetical protein
MKVLVMTTWENPKSPEGLKKYYENLNKYKNYRDEKNKKHKVKQTSWSDGTGKMYVLGEYESYESYAKFMDDEEYQKNMIALFRLVNNVEGKVLRESIWVPT